LSKFDHLVPVKREELLRICRERDLSIPKVAKMVNVSPTTIYKYLNKGQIPKILMDNICSVIFGRNQLPEDEQGPIFPIYTKDLIRAKFYLTRALNKMDEMYLKGGSNKHA